MWEQAPELLRRYKVGKIGSFDPKNVHSGRVWGWPKECTLTSNQAGKILLTIYQKRSMTYPQMRTISKSLAYAYELSGGVVPQGNYPRVHQVWALVRASECKPSTTSSKPERIPEPEELKTAFSKPWKRNHPWSLMKFLTGLVAANDGFVFGLRSRQDIKRVKDSRIHELNSEAGWVATQFLGGRAKLQGKKKGTVPWWLWRVCFCRSKKHIPVPKDFCTKIDADGNPTEEFAWCTLCPVAALELIWQLQEKQHQERRCYGKWTGAKFHAGNIGDVIAFAIEWLKVQGATSETYDSNSGRKALARWTRLLRVPYHESCPIHGDLHQTWQESYDERLPDSDYDQRQQPRDPELACAALWKFARFVGGGRKVKVRLSRQERFQYELLKTLGQKEKARRIRDGLPDEDSESSD